jgi:SAM-dependent methyltransferase
MNDNFYRAFEDKYRGPRDLIKARLQIYLQFIEPVFRAYPEGQALDVGCGRGEWLELLGEKGFNAKGIDLNDSMLHACRKLGLHVETADAIEYLKKLPSSSLCVVSGFHIAEHLPFAALQQLVAEAKRTLVPGGLLILETPNPENLSVGTNRFYLDPSHEKPIPSELLLFLTDSLGYVRSNIIGLQENPQLYSEVRIDLIHVIYCVSPDYAVIAQTDGPTSLVDELSNTFSKNFGLTLPNLAQRFQSALEERFNRIEAKADKIQAISEHLIEQLDAEYTRKSWPRTSLLRKFIHFFSKRI